MKKPNSVFIVSKEEYDTEDNLEQVVPVMVFVNQKDAESFMNGCPRQTYTRFRIDESPFDMFGT